MLNKETERNVASIDGYKKELRYYRTMFDNLRYKNKFEEEHFDKIRKGYIDIIRGLGKLTEYLRGLGKYGVNEELDDLKELASYNLEKIEKMYPQYVKD